MLEFASSFTVAMTRCFAGVGGEAVALATQVPLVDDVAGERELDDGAVGVAVRAGLALRTDAVLERGVDVVAEYRDVVGAGQGLGACGLLPRRDERCRRSAPFRITRD